MTWILVKNFVLSLLGTNRNSGFFLKKSHPLIANDSWAQLQVCDS